MGRHAAPEDRGLFHLLLAQLLGLLLAGLPVVAPATELRAWSGPPPPLVLDTVDGSRIALADLAGRPVLVHFFATWCEPCIEELAALDAAGGAARPGVGRPRRRRRRGGRARPPLLRDDGRRASRSLLTATAPPPRAWSVVGLPTSFVLDAGRAEAGYARGRRRLGRPRARRSTRCSTSSWRELRRGGQKTMMNRRDFIDRRGACRPRLAVLPDPARARRGLRPAAGAVAELRRHHPARHRRRTAARCRPGCRCRRSRRPTGWCPTATTGPATPSPSRSWTDPTHGASMLHATFAEGEAEAGPRGGEPLPDAATAPGPRGGSCR